MENEKFNNFSIILWTNNNFYYGRIFALIRQPKFGREAFIKFITLSHLNQKAAAKTKPNKVWVLKANLITIKIAKESSKTNIPKRHRLKAQHRSRFLDLPTRQYNKIIEKWEYQTKAACE